MDDAQKLFDVVRAIEVWDDLGIAADLAEEMQLPRAYLLRRLADGVLYFNSLLRPADHGRVLATLVLAPPDADHRELWLEAACGRTISLAVRTVALRVRYDCLEPGRLGHDEMKVLAGFPTFNRATAARLESWHDAGLIHDADWSRYFNPTSELSAHALPANVHVLPELIGGRSSPEMAFSENVGQILAESLDRSLLGVQIEAALAETSAEREAKRRMDAVTRKLTTTVQDFLAQIRAE